MRCSHIFIQRPVATTLITLALIMAGLLAYFKLAIAPLPQVDFPTISVNAALPGASPDTMATSVAMPLERSLGSIAGVNEITSSSSLGSTRITLQFDLSRNIDGAARDVQAAINAARSLLPSGLPSNPSYRKVNPADAPVMILALTSHTLSDQKNCTAACEVVSRAQMFDIASTILAQKISQIDGVGQVTVGGGALPAVRVELNPPLMNQLGISSEDARIAIATSNANRPKGAIESDLQHWQIAANDQAKTAQDYLPIIVGYKNGASVKLSDIANVVDGMQDSRNAGLFNSKPAIMLIINRQPGANIIKTVDQIKALMPALQASIPATIDLSVAMERTPTIRAALHEVQITLAISIVLVTLVVILFLRNLRAALIPSIVVPASLIASFSFMYLAGFSLNTLSLMALTVATGFVVDDAVVVVENTMRHIENGQSTLRSALRGAREVGFTVISMSLSLIAVFIPILLMGGIIGRLFREFAITLSIAILISLFLSLTLTPMMCARYLKSHPKSEASKHQNPSWFSALFHAYQKSLQWALEHRLIMLLVLFLTIVFNVYLYGIVPKGFFPQQDVGRLFGSIQADQSISFTALEAKLKSYVDIIRTDPAVANVVGFTGGGQRNNAAIFISLKPIKERKISADQVIARLRPKLARVPGSSLFLQAQQDIRMGGRPSNAQYQYTLQSDDITQLRNWEPRIRQVLSQLPELSDVNTDQQDQGLESRLVIDRTALARLGISQTLLNTTLNNFFGQRIVSTIYNPLNQYRVVMEASPAYTQSAESLKHVHIITHQNGSTQAIPLSSIARLEMANTPLAVNHQGQFAASTISFNLPPGISLSDATTAINQSFQKLGVPSNVYGSFQGTAKLFQASLDNQLLLIVIAFITIYIVLGILYEDLIHPITILSTLPSAGVGAILALLLFKIELSIIAFIGIILLIGIVKKNAIMMIDVALHKQRNEQLKPQQAIYEACLLRFRPIMMTTSAALLGALPLAIGFSDGAELRRPLGIAVVGGLLLSQILTLYTTPIVYLYLERLRSYFSKQSNLPS